MYADGRLGRGSAAPRHPMARLVHGCNEHLCPSSTTPPPPPASPVSQPGMLNAEDAKETVLFVFYLNVPWVKNKTPSQECLTKKTEETLSRRPVTSSLR